MKRRAGEVIGC